jgi:hypothetical protein
MLGFREEGLRTYDLGGVHEGSDPELQAVARFKRSFGGTLEASWEGEQVATARGRVHVVGRELRDRWSRRR